jgi:histone deacetylase 11
MKETVNPMPIRPKVVYSKGYDIKFLGLEKLHPFDSCKYSRAWNVLVERFGDHLIANSLVPLESVNTNTLNMVHTADYLHSLQRSHFVAKSLELASLRFLPISILDSRVLQPMRLATMGTIMAAEAALENGLAINLSGGYHHASIDRGEGFCIYSDIAVAIAMLRQSQKLQVKDQIAIVDLDAHQGNGLARIFHDDSSIRILDMYNQHIYPHDIWAQKRIDCAIPLASGTKDALYLELLKERLPAFLNEKSERPKIAFYNFRARCFRARSVCFSNIH